MSELKTKQADDLSIPLLDDVVEPAEIEYIETPKEMERRHKADHQLILEVLREGIAAQLLQELQPIVSKAIESAVDQAVKQTRQALNDELNHSLQQHIHRLIEESVAKEFDRPGRYRT